MDLQLTEGWQGQEDREDFPIKTPPWLADRDPGCSIVAKVTAITTEMKVCFRESSNRPISLVSPRIRMNLCDRFPHSETRSSCDRTSLLTLRIGDGSRTRQLSKIKVKVQHTS